MVAAWEKAFNAHLSGDATLQQFTFVTSNLENLEGQFDCLMSPANSYGIMDGRQVHPLTHPWIDLKALYSYDHYLSAAFQPSEKEYDALTRAVQATLYKEWAGYAPPGSCTLAPLPPRLIESNRFGCSYIAVLPAMRVPENVTWDKDIVYNSMWSLLASLARHHDAAVNTGEEPKIKTVLMTGLATGVGRISYTRCAEQMALAVKHFAEARENEDKWSKLNWVDVGILDIQVEKTRTL